VRGKKVAKAPFIVEKIGFDPNAWEPVGKPTTKKALSGPFF